MPVAIEDVTCWVTYGGISHIVASVKDGWTHTICDTLTTLEPDQQYPERLRVCRKCRQRLKTAIMCPDSSTESD